MRLTYICLAALVALAGPSAHAAEALPGLHTEHGELLPGDGARLHTIVTRPEKVTGRLPAVLFVQWLSCDSIELRPDAKDGWSVMLRRLITESGMLWARTEKSGVGTSKGTPCAQLDYETELAHHRAAFRQLKARPDVDPQRIVVFGASMGSNYAPLVAAGEDVAGVVVWGGGATTWFERMLGFERNALELGDTDPQALAGEVNARAAYFARYLLKGETPAAITASDPKLGEVWRRIVGTSDTGHYGRPFAFHQQAQRQNWAGAWNRVRAPVLVLHGEYDWFESRDAAQLIANIVNDRQAGAATFRELPQLDHHFTRYANRRDAFREKEGKENADPAVRAILDWLSQIGMRRGDARAKNVLDLGVAALGGSAALAGIGTVRRELTDAWIDPSQGQRPWHGGADDLPPANGGFERTPVVSFVDYPRNRWIETQQYIDSPREHALVLDAVNAERGFRTIRYLDEKPFLDEYAASDLASMTTRKFRRHPEGILRMALARADTLEWAGEDVISFEDTQGTRVRLYFEARTHLLTKAETAGDHPLMGSTTTETIFSDYRAVGALQLPLKYLDRSIGAPTRLQQVTTIQLDAVLPEVQFTPPQQVVRVEHPPDTPRLEKISESLYLIRGPYNVMFSVFPRDVVVFEAPMSTQYGQEILRMVRSVAGNKPIRCVVASHFHFDHLAGLGAFAAERIPVVAPPDAKETIEKAMSGKGFATTVEPVSKQKVFDDGDVRARVYDFGPAPHVAQILGAYFPDEKLLYVGDLLDVLTEELVIAGVDAVPMRRKMRELGLDVQRFVPVHGLPITGEQLEGAYRIRAKYLPEDQSARSSSL
jgi:glyoxylase-like metal-dependent hydrolase (beta-lactamase superfamily II)/dienelactone hydrolase